MTELLLCCKMFSIQYLSNDEWCVWVTASCLVTSLHANVSLLLRWQGFSFDMQMVRLQELRSFSTSLKRPLYRGRIRGMSSCCFQIQQKSVIRGMQWQRRQMSTNSLPLPLQRSQLSSRIEKSGEGLWICSGCSGLKSLGWHWAAQAVFIIDFTGAAGMRCFCVVVIIAADLCSSSVEA